MASETPIHVVIEKPLLNSIPAQLVPDFDPTYVEYYNKYNAGRLATHQVPIESYRADPFKYTIAYGRELVPNDGVKMTDQRCPVDGGEITVRVYEREGSSSASAPRKPVYINYHGGGWVFGGLPTDHDFCKRIVRALDCVVFDVDYRLAPEYKYPIPVEDCVAAFHWIRDQKVDEFNLDLSRIAIGGCSAGGHLSAVVAHVCRDAGIPLALQILSVPVTDLHVFSRDGPIRPDQPYPSYNDLADTQPLPRERMEYFHKAFLGTPRPDHLENDWKVSPILAPNFAGLAPALVITAEMDVLRDEGEAYGAKMKEAGCEVDIVRFKRAPHTFMLLDAILDSGKQYNEVTLAALKKTFKL
ncbi:hypothetical protein A1O1_06355 [Capronia coronata CBS 617.96]|uniref:Alpha/beta hydrolase fold-3 domain-containing protein n=1 Tax=Capronia coronata CBS 617.96 TaxID=1182541 RepID=W9Y9R9_9EURO|nr:uncharacterized protein A1O1_06355 [Capronia coronata CBS 617.96]EXJ85986.1 hypothetical protein A1O1_06355 [Capronia coronata CBS 617.96]